jgi:hypothetical protein
MDNRPPQNRPAQSVNVAIVRSLRKFDKPFGSPLNERRKLDRLFSITTTGSMDIVTTATIVKNDHMLKPVSPIYAHKSDHEKSYVAGRFVLVISKGASVGNFRAYAQS